MPRKPKSKPTKGLKTKKAVARATPKVVNTQRICSVCGEIKAIEQYPLRPDGVRRYSVCGSCFVINPKVAVG